MSASVLEVALDFPEFEMSESDVQEVALFSIDPFAAPCLPPDHTDEVIDATHIRITFADPVYVLPTLLTTIAYRITRADDVELEVLAVEAESAAPIDDSGYDATMSVILTTEEQQDGAEYTSIVFGLEWVEDD